MEINRENLHVVDRDLKGLSYQQWILVVARDFPELSTVYQIFSTPSSNDSHAGL